MKHAFSLLLISSISLATQAQKADETPYLTKSLSSAHIQSVKAETEGGNITLTGVDAGETKIEVYVRPNNGPASSLSKEEIEKRMAEDYEFTLTTDGNRLTVINRRKNHRSYNWKRELSVSYKIFVPKTITTNLITSGGNISISHVNGIQDFTTSGGNLQVDDVAGKVKGVTSGGNIHLSNSSDDIHLTTSGGNIEAINSKGTLDLTTSGGNVKLDNLKGKVDATTSGGNVSGAGVSGTLTAATSGGNVSLSDMSCTLAASTSGGHINVEIKELGSYVKLGNSGGNISLTLPGGKGLNLNLSGDKVKVGNLSNFSGKIEEDRVEGTLNGGGPLVSINGGGGRVSLTIR